MAAALLSSAVPSYGIPTLTLTPGMGAPVVVVDNGLGDISPLVGQIVYSGPVGVAWIAAVNTGVTKPLSGTVLVPEMSVDSSLVSTVADTLKVQFSDDFFGPLAPGMGFVAEDSVSSLMSGASIGFKTYGDVANAINGNDGVHAQSLVFAAASPFSAANNAPIGGPLAAPYSLTLEMAVTHVGAGISNPDMVLTAVNTPDGGSTLVLLGAAACVIGLVRSRRDS